MKMIDRLIIKAKKKCGVEQLIIAFIEPSDDEQEKWIAKGHIHNGVPGTKMKEITFTCTSIEEALKALDELAEQYPNSKDVRIFINDLGDED